MNQSKPRYLLWTAKSSTSEGRFKTGKDRKILTPWYHWNYGQWRKAVKQQSARRSRRAKLEDETPYKRFSDPWFYD